MRIAVIGAGIVGVATAFELAMDGHEVHVHEASSGVATGASFAAGSWMAADAMAGWGAAVPDLSDPVGALHLLKTLGGMARHPILAGWLWRQARAQSVRPAEAGRRLAHGLARRSVERLHDLTRDLAWEHERGNGSLLLLPCKRDVAKARTALARLEAAQIPHQLLDAEQARQIEPGLSALSPLSAAIHVPRDPCANIRQVAHLLKSEAQRGGARFHFDTEVTDIRRGNPMQLVLRKMPHRPAGLGDDQDDTAPEEDDTGDGQADAVVLCTGMDTAGLMTRLGLQLPMVAVHGHAVTAPLPVHEAAADPGPRSVIVDLQRRVQISRLGDRVRVSGGAHLGAAPNPATDRARWDALYRALDIWFPGVARTSRAQEWRGARPTLPDGLPVVGASGQPGVWLNLGHAHHGWAWACGAARELADQLAGRPASAETASLAPSRLR